MSRGALIIALLLVVARAAAAEEILVGTTGDYPPLTEYNEQSDSFEGEAIALVSEFADAHGYEIRFVRTSWPTLMEDLVAGKFQMAVGGITGTAARAEEALLSVPIRSFGKVALIRCGEEETYPTFSDIDRRGVRVVENRGGTNEQFALSRLRNATLIIVPDNTLPFQYLSEERADVMFTDSIEADYRENQGSGLCAVTTSGPYTHQEKVFLFRQGEESLVEEFNEWFLRREKAE